MHHFFAAVFVAYAAVVVCWRFCCFWISIFLLLLHQLFFCCRFSNISDETVNTKLLSWLSLIPSYKFVGLLYQVKTTIIQIESNIKQLNSRGRLVQWKTVRLQIQRSGFFSRLRQMILLYHRVLYTIFYGTNLSNYSSVENTNNAIYWKWKQSLILSLYEKEHTYLQIGPMECEALRGGLTNHIYSQRPKTEQIWVWYSLVRISNVRF